MNHRIEILAEFDLLGINPLGNFGKAAMPQPWFAWHSVYLEDSQKRAWLKPTYRFLSMGSGASDYGYGNWHYFASEQAAWNAALRYIQQIPWSPYQPTRRKVSV